MLKIETAVILAAGMGTRLRSVTNNMIPKGFLEVEGEGLVNRSIRKLREVGIKKIYIVTGHLNEYYDELAKNNHDIETFNNSRFKDTGSMASLAVLKDVIKEDFILLESDLIYEKKALIEAINHKGDSCVLLSGKTNSGDEVYIEVKDGNISNITKNKEEVSKVFGELVGVSKISLRVFKEMIKANGRSNIKQYHYENALMDSAKNIKVGYKKIEELIWAEIDDESHLNRVKKEIVPKLKRIGER